MQRGELIDKYFTDNPDQELNRLFKEKGAFFDIDDSVFEVEEIEDNDIIVHFRRFFYSFDIIENGRKVGIGKAKEPQSVQKGTFLCKNVKSLKKRQPNKKFKYTVGPRQSVKIRKKFWGNDLIIKIDTIYVNAEIICETIMPDFYGDFVRRIHAITGEPFWGKK